MHKIYGILLGMRDIPAAQLLPDVPGIAETVSVGYFMWCIKYGSASVLVDTGLKGVDIAKRGIYSIRDPESQLRALGVDPASVTSVIVTHLHSDHFSAYELYPRATFMVQRREIEFFTGPVCRSAQIMKVVSDMPEVVRLACGGRIRYLDGDQQIAPGIQVALVGGHTPGLQVVVVTTRLGQVVLCSDALDFWTNLEYGVVGQPCIDIAHNFLSWDRIRALASSSDLVIPGHEPLILERFPRVGDGIVEIG